MAAFLSQRTCLRPKIKITSPGLRQCHVASRRPHIREVQLLQREDHEKVAEVPMATGERDTRADLKPGIFGANRRNGRRHQLLER